MKYEQSKTFIIAYPSKI